jgi:hypothetical protein
MDRINSRHGHFEENRMFEKAFALPARAPGGGLAESGLLSISVMRAAPDFMADAQGPP